MKQAGYKRAVSNDDDKRGPLSKEELAARFRAMKQERYPREDWMSELHGLGYRFEERDSTCSFCGKRYALQYTSHRTVNPSAIIKEMRELGYDVKVEFPCSVNNHALAFAESF